MELPNLIGEEATNVLFWPNPQDTCGIDTPNGGVVITHMRKVVKTLWHFKVFMVGVFET